jgi:hypothetical protein|tara:strand:+ start:495 stop:923 length:429 start_codon:yes stop_codon:yes gene_type:complete
VVRGLFVIVEDDNVYKMEVDDYKMGDKGIEFTVFRDIGMVGDNREPGSSNFKANCDAVVVCKDPMNFGDYEGPQIMLYNGFLRISSFERKDSMKIDGNKIAVFSSGDFYYIHPRDSRKGFSVSTESFSNLKEIDDYIRGRNF